MNDSCFLRLDGVPRPSGAGSSWTLGAAAPPLVVRCDSRTRVATLWKGGVPARQWDDPSAALRWMCEVLRADRHPRHPPQKWVGYLSYDFGRLFERVPSVAADDVGMPLFEFGLVDSYPRAPHYPISSKGEQDRPLTSTFGREAYQARSAGPSTTSVVATFFR